MANFQQAVSILEHAPFLMLVPKAAQPPNGHFILAEVANLLSTRVSNSMLGRVAVVGLSLSHYTIGSESETINYDDLQRVFRQKSFNKCPEAELSTTLDGHYQIVPMVRSGQGKNWDMSKATVVSHSADFEAVGAAIRDALDTSRNSFVVV